MLGSERGADMLILPDNDVIFVHVPKCGGTSFKAALAAAAQYSIEARGLANGFDRCHLTLEQIQSCCPILWREMNGVETLSVAIVRNPYDRIISAYKWYLKHYDFLSFESYLQATELLAEWDCRLVHAVPQHRFIYLNERKFVSLVIKLETIQRDISKIRDALSLRGTDLGDVPTLNASDHCPAIDSVAAHRELILKQYAKDFELFGYSVDMN